jgi:hypothetical protein
MHLMSFIPSESNVSMYGGKRTSNSCSWISIQIRRDVYIYIYIYIYNVSELCNQQSDCLQAE